MDKTKNMWARGDIFIWMTGATLAACMILISGLLLAIMVNGVVIFWPSDIYRLELKDNTTVIGEIKEREEFFLHQDGKKIPEGFRIQVKRGNRDLYGDDYIWINEDDITSKSRPDALTVFERLEWGNFYGVIEEFRESGKTLATGQDQALAAFQKEMQVQEIRGDVRV